MSCISSSFACDDIPDRIGYYDGNRVRVDDFVARNRCSKNIDHTHCYDDSTNNVGGDCRSVPDDDGFERAEAEYF